MNIGIAYYIAGICENIASFTSVIGLMCFSASVVLILSYYLSLRDSIIISEQNLGKKFISIVKIISPISIICLIVTLILPTKKEFVAMYVAPKIENNEKVIEITDKALDKIIEMLETKKKGL